MGQPALPTGFRFKPTDQELLAYFLRCKTLGQVLHGDTIAEVDIYKFEPWDLPEKSALPSKDQEWYFFSAQDKKYSQTARINRTTRKGYWKATGKDRKVNNESCIIGLKKTLIYYEGRAPNGKRTDWVMHEYRLDEETEKKETIICPAVLCRIRRKGGLGPRNGEQYGAPVSYEGIEASVGDLPPIMGKAKQEGDQSIDGGGFLSVGDQVVNSKPRSGPLEHMEYASGEDALVSKGRHMASSLLPIANQIEVASLEKMFSFGGQEEVDLPIEMPDENPFSNLGGFGGQDEETLRCMDQLIDMPEENLLSNLPPLPSLSDVDVEGLYDYIARGQAEMMGEMWDLVSGNDKSAVSNATWDEVLISQPLSRNNYCGSITGVHSLVSDGFIELNDMKLPLEEVPSGFTTMYYGSEFGRPQEQEFCSLSDMVGRTPEVLQSQGVAARRIRLQVPVHGVRAKESQINYPGLNDSTTMVEGPTKSFLAKHMSYTYAVATCEMIPPSACHAALTVGEDENARSSDSSQSATTTSLLMKDKSSVGAKALDLMSPLSTSNSIQNGKLSDVEVLHSSANPSSNQHSWKMAFREVVSSTKNSRWGSILRSLDGHVGSHFDHNVPALGKPIVRLLPAAFPEDHAGPYDFLKKGVLLTLWYLVVTVLIFFCLFWGYRVLRKYAISALV